MNSIVAKIIKEVVKFIRFSNAYVYSITYTMAYLIVSFVFYMKTDRSFPLVATDTREYVNSFVYMVKTGHYFPDIRMPGFGVPFLIWYVLSKDYTQSLVFMAFFYMTLCTLGIYISLFLAHKHLGGHKILHLFGISWTSSIAVESWWLLPDPSISVATSLSLLFLLRKNYLTSGFFHLISFIFRPTNLIIFLFSAIIVMLLNHSLRNRLKRIIFLFLPTFVYDLAWTTRNFMLYGDFRPFYGHGSFYRSKEILIANSIGMNQILPYHDYFNYVDLEKSLPSFVSIYHYLDTNIVEKIGEFYLYHSHSVIYDNMCANEKKKDSIYKAIITDLRLPFVIKAMRSAYTGLFHSLYYSAGRNVYVYYRGLSFILYIATSSLILTFLFIYLIANPMSRESIRVLFGITVLLYSIVIPWGHILSGVVETRYLLIWNPAMALAIGIVVFTLKKNNISILVNKEGEE